MIEAWDRFWFSPFDPIALSFMRINMGLLLVVMYLANSFNWERFYARDGVVSLQVPTVALASPEDTLNLFYWTEAWLPLNFWWWAGLIGAICFTLGFQTRIATFLLFLLQCSMINRSRIVCNGEDLVFRIVLFHSLFAPTNRCLALDSWIRARRGAANRGLPWIWPLRMLQLSVVIIYLVSLPYKFRQDWAWAQGYAIYYTMASDMWYRGWFPQLAYRWGLWFSYLATYGTVLIEGSFPFLVWIPRTRMLAVVSLTMLHLGIAIFIPNVTLFTLSMVAFFWVFYPPELLHRWVKTIRARFGLKL